MRAEHCVGKILTACRVIDWVLLLISQHYYKFSDWFNLVSYEHPKYLITPSFPNDFPCLSVQHISGDLPGEQ